MADFLKNSGQTSNKEVAKIDSSVTNATLKTIVLRK
jgi:hypothetical protein